MKRSIERWKNCNPKAMAKQSEAAIMYAFMDAKEDILKMAEALQVIAYPRRGTEEENMDIEDIINYIHTNFSREDLL